MIRVEIFANQSMQDLLINNLEAAVPGFLYSIVPLAHGRGGESYKLGTSTWPETNVILIAYCDDDKEQAITTVVDYLKEKFPTEGIKMFVLHDR
ncbi:PG0541 family transporter-associated protein [Treponema sp.]|uniref:PG0541 family transporter-associated protein n=1 Tax=Treponema sp. TaxID=166 RepID=UPI00388FE941